MHLLAAAALAFSALVVPPDPVPVDLTAAGRGCPVGGLAVAMDPGNSSFTVRSLGDPWVHAASGKGTTIADERKTCQMSFKIIPPKGWTFALGDAEYHGTTELQRGATGSLRIQSYFQGSTVTHNRQWAFTGPSFAEWSRIDAIPVEERAYHPCGSLRNLNVTVELRASKGTSDPTTINYLYRDAYETTYGLHWKKCP